MKKVFTRKNLNHLARLLILIGLILILGAIMIRSYYNKKAEKILIELEAHIIAQQANSNNDSKSNSDITEASEDDKSSDIDYKNTYILDIPSIGIHSLIKEGTSKSVLKYAVGHFEDTATPGQNGNCCLAGHSSIVYNNIFNGLEENIKKGDSINISGVSGNYEYIVTDFFVVEPTDVYVLEQTKDATLTISTCTDRGKKRFIVKAALK